MQLYLITGFLGAGKTCLIKNLIEIFKDKTLYLIINEFGREGIDGSILAETGTALEEINNGSIFCKCKYAQFETALEHAITQQPEIILVEASGLADPAGIRSILSQDKFCAIEWMGGICLVDAKRFMSVAKTARVIKRQLAVSGLALINKSDLATPEEISTTKQEIQQINPGIAMQTTSYGKVESVWLHALNTKIPLEKACHNADITLQNKCIELKGDFTKSALTSFLSLFIEDTYRVKGFVTLQEGDFLVDCVGPIITIERWAGKTPSRNNHLVLLAGAGMPLRNSLAKAIALYPDRIEQI